MRIRCGACAKKRIGKSRSTEFPCAPAVSVGGRGTHGDRKQRRLRLLNKVSFKGWRELGMVEQPMTDHIAVSTFLDTKSNSDCERIISIVDDATVDDFPRKAAPQSHEIPFAAENI